jgi:peptide/nickel transport system substrate-binding protein
MRLLKTTAAVAAVVALPLAAGCTVNSVQHDSSRPSSSLALGDVLAPATFEAANMNWGNQSVYAQAVYDTLLRQNPNGVGVEPALATKWQYNPGKTVLTLTLRTGVKFTDGTAFNATVAAENLLRFRDGTSPQRAKAAEVVTAKAITPTTLQITLKQPDPAFLVYLTQVAGLEESPKAFNTANAATVPVGSGPYTLDTKNTVVGSSYVFVRNPHYWDPASVHYDTITVNVYEDDTSMLNALRGHQLNGAGLNDNTTLPQVQQAGYKTYPTFLNMDGLYLWDRGGKLNPALGNVKVRQAINYAIDAKAFLKVSALGYGKLTQQPFRTGSAGYVQALNSTYSYDPAKAKQLLAQAGYPNGFSLTMPVNSSDPQSLNALIQQQLGAVGIKVTFQDVSTNLLPDMLAGKYAASYFQLQQDPVVPQLIGFMVAPEATWNPFHYGDSTSERLIAQVRQGGSAGAQASRELNTYLVKQAWFDPWYTVQTSFVADSATRVTVNQDNAYPNLWDITPAS